MMCMVAQMSTSIRTCNRNNFLPLPFLLSTMMISKPSHAIRPLTTSHRRPLSSTTTKKSDKTSHEHKIISQLTPLKKILCLCPIPLGRGRVLWSGGDSFNAAAENTIHMNFRNERGGGAAAVDQKPRIAKYRYGERYTIGVAVSDAYLTHAEPVSLEREFVAEMVPSFRCDSHNLGASPIFYTNLPYFRKELLRSIGHYDIGAVVIGLPMKPTANPFSPAPTRIQLEQERKLEAVRDGIMGVMQNYICQDGDEFDEESAALATTETLSTDKVVQSNSSNTKQRHGPLGLQGYIDHRMSLAEVLSKTYDRGSWGHITKAVRRIQNQHTLGNNDVNSSSNFAGNKVHGSRNTYTSIPPEIHAAVALNGMMEKYTSAFHSTFF